MSGEEIKLSAGARKDEPRDPNADRFTWHEGDTEIVRPGDPEYIDDSEYDDDTKAVLTD